MTAGTTLTGVLGLALERLDLLQQCYPLTRYQQEEVEWLEREARELLSLISECTAAEEARLICSSAAPSRAPAPRPPSGLELGQLLGICACALAWRFTGLRAAGRPIVRLLASDKPEIRLIAEALLLRSGRLARPLLFEALSRRVNMAETIKLSTTLMADEIEAALWSWAEDSDVRVARAARVALAQFPLMNENLPSVPSWP